MSWNNGIWDKLRFVGNDLSALFNLPHVVVNSLAKQTDETTKITTSNKSDFWPNAPLLKLPIKIGEKWSYSSLNGLSPIISEFEELWLTRSRREGIEQNLNRYERLKEHYDSLLERLSVCAG